MLFLALVVAITGCNSIAKPPRITHAGVVPPDLRPGDSAVITVTIKDRNHVVDKVEGVVKEDPRLKLRLRDDGQDPDARANDGTWSLRVDVPFQAPPGKFDLEFIAYRNDGTPVPVRQDDGNYGPLMTDLSIDIQYAAEEAK